MVSPLNQLNPVKTANRHPPNWQWHGSLLTAIGYSWPTSVLTSPMQEPQPSNLCSGILTANHTGHCSCLSAFFSIDPAIVEVIHSKGDEHKSAKCCFARQHEPNNAQIVTSQRKCTYLKLTDPSQKLVRHHLQLACIITGIIWPENVVTYRNAMRAWRTPVAQQSKKPLRYITYCVTCIWVPLRRWIYWMQQNHMTRTRCTKTFQQPKDSSCLHF